MYIIYTAYIMISDINIEDRKIFYKINFTMFKRPPISVIKL